jgi:HlyD family secretion protein
MNDMSQARAGIHDTLGIAKSGKKKSPWRRRLIWGGGILAVLAVGWWLMSGMFGGGEETGFQSQAVARGPLNVRVTATGNLQPIDQVDVGAEVSGRVVAVNVDFNSVVKKDDVLAQIDTTELEARRIQVEAQLVAAQAQVREAEAGFADAQRRLERLQGLSEGRTVSQQDLDTAKATFDRASANLEVARAQVKLQQAALDVAQSNIEKAVIRSPIDGIVLYRSIEPGQTVAASFQTPVLFTLASDINKLELLADIDEADVGQVQEGQRATFTVDAFPNRTFDATVVSLRNAPKKAEGAGSGGGAGQASVVVYQAVLSADNAAGLLKPGMTATAEVTVKSLESALLVPNAALRFVPMEISMREAAAAQDGPQGPVAPRDPSAGRVFVLGVDGKPSERKLTLGVTDGIATEIVSGELAEGDQVLTDMRRRLSGAQ